MIKAATKAQVEHVYYTSGLRADDVRFEIGADHKATEDALIASGVTYTILRNGWYIENYIQAMAGPPLHRDSGGGSGRCRRCAR